MRRIGSAATALVLGFLLLPPSAGQAATRTVRCGSTAGGGVTKLRVLITAGKVPMTCAVAREVANAYYRKSGNGVRASVVLNHYCVPRGVGEDQYAVTCRPSRGKYSIRFTYLA